MGAPHLGDGLDFPSSKTYFTLGMGYIGPTYAIVHNEKCLSEVNKLQMLFIGKV